MKVLVFTLLMGATVPINITSYAQTEMSKQDIEQTRVYSVVKKLIQNNVSSSITFPSKPIFYSGNNNNVFVMRGKLTHMGKQKEYILRMNYLGGEWSMLRSWSLKAILLDNNVVYPKI